MNVFSIQCSLLFRQRSELEALQEELREAKAELSQVRVQLAQNDKVSTQAMPINDKVVLTPVSVDILYFLPSCKSNVSNSGP